MSAHSITSPCRRHRNGRWSSVRPPCKAPQSGCRREDSRWREGPGGCAAACPLKQHDQHRRAVPARSRHPQPRCDEEAPARLVDSEAATARRRPPTPGGSEETADSSARTDGGSMKPPAGEEHSSSASRLSSPVTAAALQWRDASCGGTSTQRLFRTTYLIGQLTKPGAVDDHAPSRRQVPDAQAFCGRCTGNGPAGRAIGGVRHARGASFVRASTTT